MWSASSDRKRKFCELLKTCMEKLVKSHQRNLFLAGFCYLEPLCIGAKMSRHVGAKSQRFLDFNFSKAFLGLLVSFLKILSFHSTTNNQSESMEDFRNLEKGNFEKKTLLLKLKWSEPDTYPSHVVELFVYFSRFYFYSILFIF